MLKEANCPQVNAWYAAYKTRPAMEATMDVFLELVGELPMYHLSFTPDASVFAFVERELGLQWDGLER